MIVWFLLVGMVALGIGFLAGYIVGYESRSRKWK